MHGITDKLTAVATIYCGRHKGPCTSYSPDESGRILCRFFVHWFGLGHLAMSATHCIGLAELKPRLVTRCHKQKDYQSKATQSNSVSPGNFKFFQVTLKFSSLSVAFLSPVTYERTCRKNLVVKVSIQTRLSARPRGAPKPALVSTLSPICPQ